MDFKFFRILRIIGLVGSMRNFTIQQIITCLNAYHAYKKCLNLSLKLYVMSK